jgi:hypothetical protein
LRDLPEPAGGDSGVLKKQGGTWRRFFPEITVPENLFGNHFFLDKGNDFDNVVLNPFNKGNYDAEQTIESSFSKSGARPHCEIEGASVRMNQSAP